MAETTKTAAPVQEKRPQAKIIQRTPATVDSSHPDGRRIDRHPLLRIQRRAGNQTVGRLLDRQNGTGSSPSPIQTSLTVNEPGDQFEQEAEVVARKVSGSANGHTSANGHIPAVQRQNGSGPGPPPVTSRTATTLRNPGPGKPIPAPSRQRIEPHLGADLSQARVHETPAAAEAAVSLEARAFTFGGDIFLGAGESTNDTHLMAHEATHVVQQNEGVGRTPVVQRGILDAVGSGFSTAWEHTGGAAIEAGVELVEEGVEYLWEQLKEEFPALGEFVDDVEKAGGIVNYVQAKIEGLVDLVFGGLKSMANDVKTLVSDFTGFLESVAGLAADLASGDPERFSSAIDRLVSVFTKIIGVAKDAIIALFQPISDFFGDLAALFDGSLIDSASEAASTIWGPIDSIVSNVSEVISDSIPDWLEDGWDWVKEEILGIEGSFWDWVKEGAEKAWDWVKENVLKSAIELIGGIAGAISEFLSMESINSLAETAESWLVTLGEMVKALVQPGNEENQGVLRQLIPAILAPIQETLISGIEAARDWIVSKITAVTGWFTGLPDAFSWIKDAAVTLTGWATVTVAGVFNAIIAGINYLPELIIKVLEILGLLLTIATNPVDGMSKLAESVWNLIPEWIREPVKQFVMDLLQRIVPIFKEIIDKAAEIWGAIQSLAIRVLEKVFVEGDLAGAAWEIFKALLEAFGIPPELVVDIINKAVSAIKDIINNPIGFLINLLKAIKEGFSLFFANIGTHLFNGVVNWLLAQLQGAGITPPADFSLQSIMGMVLEILGITLDNVFERLALKIGREKVEMLKKGLDLLTGAWSWVVKLINEGPAAVWQDLMEKLSGLWQTVMDAAIAWITEKIITTVTAKLLSLLDPTGIMAVVNSIIAIYKAIQSFMEYIRQMLEIVNKVLDVITDIARGPISGAATLLEGALADALPIAIGFLANQLNLGRLSEKLREIIQTVREKINMAIDWLIDKALQIGGAIFDTLKSGATKVKEAVVNWWKEKRTVKVGKKTHTVAFEGSEEKARLVIASSPGVGYKAYLESVEAQMKTAEQKKSHKEAGKVGERIDKNLASRKKSETETNALVADLNTMADLLRTILGGAPVPPSIIKYGSVTSKQGGKYAEAQILSQDGGGSKGSEPADDPPIWSAVQDRKSDENKRAYVQGHLLNHNVHGPGKRFNMTPITYSANAKHKEGIEKDIKERILDNAEVVYYKVTAEYGDHPDSADYKNLKDKPEASRTTDEKWQLQAMETDRELATNFVFDAHTLEQGEKGKWEPGKDIKYPHVENKIPTKAPGPGGNVAEKHLYRLSINTPGGTLEEKKEALLKLEGMGDKRAGDLAAKLDKGKTYRSWAELIEDKDILGVTEALVDKWKAATNEVDGKRLVYFSGDTIWKEA